jgi:FkbM family methyltransferase
MKYEQSDISMQFEYAVNAMHKSVLLKILRPGIHKFIIRKYAQATGITSKKYSRLFFDDYINVILPERISETIYTYGFFDEKVTRLVMAAVRKGDTVIDVGAHIGYFSLLLSKLVGESGRVVSFEPTPSTYKILKDNTLKHQNIQIENLAIGDFEGVMPINDYGLIMCAWNTLSSTPRDNKLNTDTAGNIVDVNVVSLDSYVIKNQLKPDVIKIDAENYESNVIKGMFNTIKLYHPKIIMEIGGQGAENVIESLIEMNYKPHVTVKDTGELKEWLGTISELNDNYVDALFIAQDISIRA